jgi:hypothetical protein
MNNINKITQLIMLTNEKKTGKVGEDGVKATWG